MSITQNIIFKEYLFALKCFFIPRILEEDFLDHFLEGMILFPLNPTWKPVQSQKITQFKQLAYSSHFDSGSQNKTGLKRKSFSVLVKCLN